MIAKTIRKVAVAAGAMETAAVAGTTALLLTVAGAHAQTANLPAIIVTARPVVEEVSIDAFSSTSAVITQDQLRDQNAVDLAFLQGRPDDRKQARAQSAGQRNGAVTD